MKVYLVGGAVRDELLGREVYDRDFLVVGSNPEEMTAKGFKSVGKSFPVFLHPETNEEYALARKEKKVGAGYKGFEFEFDESITLEDDLKRRDFTINAMAKDGDKIIDLHNGKEDLKKKLLRHVSEHFEEDPLRVIRGIRFAATLGFEFASETKKLIKKMIERDLLQELSSDRIFKEIEKVLEVKRIKSFIDICREFDIDNLLFCQTILVSIEREDLSVVEVFASLNLNEKFFNKYNVPKKIKKLTQAFGLYHELSLDINEIKKFFKLIRKDLDVLKSIEKIKKRKFSLIPTLEKLNKKNNFNLEERERRETDIIQSFIRNQSEEIKLHSD